MTPGIEGWQQPILITGTEWRWFATVILAGLTPASPGRAKYYRGLLGDRILYRDVDGRPAAAPVNQPPTGVVVEQRYSIEESLQLLATLAEPQLRKAYPGASLFLLIIHPVRSPQPLFLDLDRHRCVWLSTAALFETEEPLFGLVPTFQGIGALVLESNGLALLKNPVSSLGRLGNLLVQLTLGLVRLPLVKPTGPVPPLTHAQGMNLVEWENWLDKHTGSHREHGSLRLLIDGERFFPRFQQAISNATDHVSVHVFIFDNDDVALDIADALRQKSVQVTTSVIIDRLASRGAATISPATPPAKSYVPMSSISSYLKHDSRVQVRPFLNVFCSFDHSKIYLVDGVRAWMGGMNIGREYRSEWHDMMVELEGPVVGCLEYQYHLDWAHAGPLGDLSYLGALLKTSQPRQAVPKRLGLRCAYCPRRLPESRLPRRFSTLSLERKTTSMRKILTCSINRSCRGWFVPGNAASMYASFCPT